MWTPILLFLKANWLWVAVGVAFLALLAYANLERLEKEHYHNQLIVEKQEFAAYRANNEAMSAAWKSSNAALTLAAKERSINELKADAARRQAVSERIKADEASKRIVIPAESVRVLDSTAQSTAAANESPPSLQGNAGVSSTPYTLNDIEEWAAYNNANHLACVKQVIQWQDFWKQFEQNTQQAQARGSG